MSPSIGPSESAENVRYFVISTNHSCAIEIALRIVGPLFLLSTTTNLDTRNLAALNEIQGAKQDKKSSDTCLNRNQPTAACFGTVQQARTFIAIGGANDMLSGL